VTFSVSIIGAGKVGTALARALRAAGAQVHLRALRRGVPHTPIEADLLILAVRDAELSRVCRQLAAGRICPSTPVVHCSGMLGPEALDNVRRASGGTAQMHPMISFASTKRTPPLARGNMLVRGDRKAVRAARILARLLGMTARSGESVDSIAYHAAAGFVANGAATLAAIGVKLLMVAGVDSHTAAQMLGPLLASVAANVERLGLPAALTGPVRRGDARAVAHHRTILENTLPEQLALFDALIHAQIPFAEMLGEAPPEKLQEIRGLVKEANARPGQVR
jgi:predicted short-subunit dehydrogenase-like oxidoreductase (DUF2520 family)